MCMFENKRVCVTKQEQSGAGLIKEGVTNLTQTADTTSASKYRSWTSQSQQEEFTCLGGQGRVLISLRFMQEKKSRDNFIPRIFAPNVLLSIYIISYLPASL